MTQSLSLPSNSAALCCLSAPPSAYRWGANWCGGMQLRRLPNCQGAKSKGVSFVNYTQCYKQPPPFFSSGIFKYFGSGAKRKKKGEERTIYTQLSQWDEQTFVWMTISAELGGGGASRHKTTASMRRDWRRAARPRKNREHASGRLLLRPGIRQKCSGSRC